MSHIWYPVDSRYQLRPDPRMRSGRPMVADTSRGPVAVSRGISSMTAQQDPYVRVYYRINSDDKFVGLDAAAIGTWVKLLIVADAMHPAAAPIPRWVEEEPLAELVKAG